MAKEGDKNEAEEEKPDPKRDYDEEKLKMRAVKTLMSKKNKEVRKCHCCP